MRISPETREEVREILRRVVKNEIPIRWRSSMRTLGAGERRSKNRGRGDDFDGARQYVPGDDTRLIDWKRKAMTGEILVKQFLQTTEIKAFVIADVNQTMNFGTARATKRRLAAELAASCIASLDKTKDRVGAMLFSAHALELTLKPQIANVRTRYMAAASIMEKQPSVLKGDGNGLTKALKRLPNKRSLVFIISDFMNLSDSDWETLNRAGRQHDVICLYVQDLRERELPEVTWGKGPLGWLTGLFGSFYTLEDWTGSRRVIWLSKKTRSQYAANFRTHEAKIVTRLKESRCRWLVVSTEEGDSAYPKLLKTFGATR